VGWVLLSLLAKCEVDRIKVEGVAASLVVGFLVRISPILVWLGQVATTRGRKSELFTPTSSEDKARLYNEQGR
jgi:hypothetical protein